MPITIYKKMESNQNTPQNVQNLSGEKALDVSSALWNTDTMWSYACSIPKQEDNSMQSLK